MLPRCFAHHSIRGLRLETASVGDTAAVGAVVECFGVALAGRARPRFKREAPPAAVAAGRRIGARIVERGIPHHAAEDLRHLIFVDPLQVLFHLVALVENQRQLHGLVRRPIHPYAFFMDDVARKHRSDYDLDDTWLLRGGSRPSRMDRWPATAQSAATEALEPRQLRPVPAQPRQAAANTRSNGRRRRRVRSMDTRTKSAEPKVRAAYQPGISLPDLAERAKQVAQ
jgi:hypothetical protein